MNQAYHDLTPAFHRRLEKYEIKQGASSAPSYELRLEEFYSSPAAPPRGIELLFDPLITECRSDLRAALSSVAGKRAVDLRDMKANIAAILFYGIAGGLYFSAMLAWYLRPTPLMSAWFGFLAWIFTGLLQHEGSHSALSRSPMVNWFGRMAIIPWANPRTWFIKHTVSHHQFTNTSLDQDVQKSWFLRHHEDISWTFYHHLQVLTIHIGGVFELFLYSTKDTIKDLKERPPRWEESALYAVLALASLGYHLASHRSPTLTLLPYCIYGACFSTITQWSHVQEECFEEKLLAAPKNFVRHQVASCVDYGHGNWAVTIFSIFLNYQTYHHLFPGISHFQLVQPEVKRAIDQTLNAHGLLTRGSEALAKGVGYRSAFSACATYLKYLGELSKKNPRVHVAKGE